MRWVAFVQLKRCPGVRYHLAAPSPAEAERRVSLGLEREAKPL